MEAVRSSAMIRIPIHNGRQQKFSFSPSLGSGTLWGDRGSSEERTYGNSDTGNALSQPKDQTDFAEVRPKNWARSTTERARKPAAG